MGVQFIKRFGYRVAPGDHDEQKQTGLGPRIFETVLVTTLYQGVALSQVEISAR